ncbi:MAG TPA: FimV/HubP family polar landmark protein [Gammaproteobacteria bacterium]|nr:FimV/HubP family polar landmark protein [Gammaproteobacteria bacterium]
MLYTVIVIILSTFFSQALATFNFNAIESSRLVNQTEYYTRHLPLPQTKASLPQPAPIIITKEEKSPAIKTQTKASLPQPDPIIITKEEKLPAIKAQTEQTAEQIKLAILDLKKDIKSIKDNINAAPKVASSAPVYLSQNQNIFDQPPTFWFLGSISLLLVMSALRSIIPIRREVKAPTNSNYDLEEDEYDFLGSEEGLPSKLDLARAYIEMNEYKEAEKTLNEIIATGNIKYANKARSLIKSIH